MRSALYILLPLCLLAGCISSHQSAAHSTSAIMWNADAPAVIRFDNTDTASIRDTRLVLRHDSRIKTNSVVLRINSLSPDSSRRTDTLTVTLRRNPLSGDICQSMQTVPGYTRLHCMGQYTFEIAPLAPVRGIWGTALDFSKTTK